VRELRAMRRDPAARRAAGAFLAEGVHLAEEALAAGARIRHAVVSPRLGATEPGRRLLERLVASGAEGHEASDALMESLQDARSPQPVLCVVERDEPGPEVWPPRGREPVAVLWGLQDPGNVGTIVRTADAAGCGLVVACGPGADPLHPRAVRATAGAVFRIAIVREDDPEATLARLGAAGLARLAADARGSTSWDRADLATPFALVLGGEGAGLPASIREHVDRSVRVTMREGAESLSVGAAAAAILFEAVRQRRASAG